jgi:isoleucyl-tRNA synthetase
VTLVFPNGERSPLSAEDWAEILIVSGVSIADPNDPAAVPVPLPAATAGIGTAGIGPGIGMKVDTAPGTKCARCWRVLQEVGHQPNHPTLCARCADAVESGLVCRPAA